MSTRLIISTQQWAQTEPDLALYEEDVRRKRETLLKKELARIAELELRETEQSRPECLRQFKLWIAQNQDIRNCLMESMAKTCNDPTPQLERCILTQRMLLNLCLELDDNFLLRFLRVKKFSIPMAQQTLLKYLNYRKRFPQIFLDMDYSDSSVNQLISSGYIFVSPLRDTNGRRVVIYDLSKFNPKRHSGTDMARAHVVTYETLLSEEENQILGVSHVANIAGVNASFLTLFSVTDFGYLIKWGEQSFPMRHKEVHCLNMPQALRYVYDFAKSNMSQKLKERIMVHDSMESLFEKVDKRCLPKEMGGEIPREEMVSSWQTELENRQKRLLTIDQIELLSDRGIICSRNAARNALNTLSGSFRKLEVD